MIKDMKIFMNGQEIEIPNEIKQLMSLTNLALTHQQNTPINPFNRMMSPPQKVRCIDEQVRGVLIEMNKRLIELEKLVNESLSKPIKKKTKKIKLSSDTSITKGSSKKKSKVTKVNKVTNIKKK